MNASRAEGVKDWIGSSRWIKVRLNNRKRYMRNDRRTGYEKCEPRTASYMYFSEMQGLGKLMISRSSGIRVPLKGRTITAEYLHS
jgi:hypothetical protein